MTCDKPNKQRHEKKEQVGRIEEENLITNVEDPRVNDIAFQVQQKNGVKYGDITPWELDSLEQKLETKGMTRKELTEWCEHEWPIASAKQ